MARTAGWRFLIGFLTLIHGLKKWGKIVTITLRANMFLFDLWDSLLLCVYTGEVELVELTKVEKNGLCR